MNEMRLDRRVHRVHSDFIRETVRLSRVARAARRDDVGPLVRATARKRDEMVARERLARLEFHLEATAVLAAIAIAREEERVGDLPAETTGHVNKPHQPDDCRARKREPFRADHLVVVRFDDLCLSVNDQP